MLSTERAKLNALRNKMAQKYRNSKERQILLLHINEQPKAKVYPRFSVQRGSKCTIPPRRDQMKLSPRKKIIQYRFPKVLSKENLIGKPKPKNTIDALQKKLANIVLSNASSNSYKSNNTQSIKSGSSKSCLSNYQSNSSKGSGKCSKCSSSGSSRRSSGSSRRSSGSSKKK